MGESSRRRLVLSQNTTSVPVNYILGAFATVTSQETMTEVAESFVDDLSDAVTTATGLTVSTELSPDATPAEPVQEDDELPPLEEPNFSAANYVYAHPFSVVIMVLVALALL